MGKGKKIKAGTISGLEVIKKTRPPQDIPFRTGRHMTEKDRPRKKLKPQDIEEL